MRLVGGAGNYSKAGELGGKGSSETGWYFELINKKFKYYCGINTHSVKNIV